MLLGIDGKNLDNLLINPNLSSPLALHPTQASFISPENDGGTSDFRSLLAWVNDKINLKFSVII